MLNKIVNIKLATVQIGMMKSVRRHINTDIDIIYLSTGFVIACDAKCFRFASKV